MNHLDLCSGIGGFSLAARWMGWNTIQFVEIDKFCQKVLRKHWPEVPIHDDLKTFNRQILEESLSRIRDPKYDEAAKLYQDGHSVGDLALRFGISRQAMWRILKRRLGELRSNLRFGETNHFYRGGARASDMAQNLLEEAIQRGSVIRRETCETCGDSGKLRDGRTKIHAHHCDYNKPLEVMWLCQKCHHEWHRNNQPIARKEVPEVASSDSLIDILTAGYP